jgi:heme/copper-type cytochrome/quinol oxidase subunit 2
MALFNVFVVLLIAGVILWLANTYLRKSGDRNDDVPTRGGERREVLGPDMPGPM